MGSADVDHDPFKIRGFHVMLPIVAVDIPVVKGSLSVCGELCAIMTLLPMRTGADLGV